MLAQFNIWGIEVDHRREERKERGKGEEDFFHQGFNTHLTRAL